MRPATICSIWLLVSGLCWTACRQVSVCDRDVDCAPLSTAGEGGAFAPAPAEGGAPAPALVEGGGPSAGTGTGGAAHHGDETLGGAGQNGAAGAGGEATGGSLPMGPPCVGGHAECDESTLTVCETPTSYSYRHCGACNARCDGVCSNGNCKPHQELLDRDVEDFVANASAAYALVSAPNDTENLHRFNLDDGADSVIAEGLDPSGHLRLGSNRLYVFYGFEKIVSLGLDGSGATTEAISTGSFRVTNAGSYYTSYDFDPETEVETWTLWFRAQGTGAFTAISAGKECYVLGSSSQALLVGRATDDDTEEILLVKGAELTSLGASPANWITAAAVPGGAVFLVTNDAAKAGYELVWLRPEQPPEHTELEAEPVDDVLVPAPEGVALQLEDRYNSFVRLFSGSSTQLPLGIPLNSTLVYVDERYFWYSWYGAPDLTEHFQRARQFEPNDFLP